MTIWSRWRRRLGIFAAGQLAVQALTFATGLLLMRWMSEDEYAKTGVVLGFQFLLNSFVDLGVGGALVALIGGRGDRPRVVGEYVAAARWWRRLLLALVLPVAAGAFLFLNNHQGWPIGEALVLYLCVALTLYGAGLQAWASAALLIHQRLGSFYATSNAAAIARLAGSLALYQAGMLDAVTITILNTLISVAAAWRYWVCARRHVDEPVRSSPEVRTEILRYVAPLVPMSAFFALQGQLTTFLVAYFGQAQHIAEVTALGRLGQLFAFLSAAFSTLVMPYCARLPADLFRRRYPWAAAATIGLAAAISALAFAVPEPLLWLLGPRYSHLRLEVMWTVLASSLAFAGGAIWMIHAARQWVFWSGTALYVVSVTLVQVIYVAQVDLASTLHVVQMGVVTAGAALLTQTWVAWLGLRRSISAAAQVPPRDRPVSPSSEPPAWSTKAIEPDVVPGAGPATVREGASRDQP